MYTNDTHYTVTHAVSSYVCMYVCMNTHFPCVVYTALCILIGFANRQLLFCGQERNLHHVNSLNEETTFCTITGEEGKTLNHKGHGKAFMNCRNCPKPLCHQGSQ